MPKPKFTNIKPIEHNAVGISNDNHCYDLHNNADFLEVIYNRKERKATLIWEYPGKWFLNDCKLWKDDKKYLKENDIENSVRLIGLIFHNVNRFEISPRDPEMPYTEDNCLAQIYTYDEENDYREDVFIFVFHSDMKVKIEAEEVVFKRDYHKK